MGKQIYLFTLLCNCPGKENTPLGTICVGMILHVPFSHTSFWQSQAPLPIFTHINEAKTQF